MDGGEAAGLSCGEVEVVALDGVESVAGSFVGEGGGDGIPPFVTLDVVSALAVGGAADVVVELAEAVGAGTAGWEFLDVISPSDIDLVGGGIGSLLVIVCIIGVHDIFL